MGIYLIREHWKEKWSAVRFLVISIHIIIFTFICHSVGNLFITRVLKRKVVIGQIFSNHHSHNQLYIYLSFPCESKYFKALNGRHTIAMGAAHHIHPSIPLPHTPPQKMPGLSTQHSSPTTLQVVRSSRRKKRLGKKCFYEHNST